MRISDWSSDVCSSDLGCGRAGVWGPALALAWQDRWCSWRLGLPCCGGRVNAAIGHRRGKSGEADIEPPPASLSAPRRDQRIGPGERGRLEVAPRGRTIVDIEIAPLVRGEARPIGLVRRHRGRSEEHKSEPPSLMRILYAGFCLHKNT